MSALKGRLDALREQDAALADQLASQAHTTLDRAELAAVGSRVEDVMAAGEPKQAKAPSFAYSLKNSASTGGARSPSAYRFATDAVGALPSSVAIVGCSGRGELSHLLLLFLFFLCVEDHLQRVSAQVAAPDEPLVLLDDDRGGEADEGRVVREDAGPHVGEFEERKVNDSGERLAAVYASAR